MVYLSICIPTNLRIEATRDTIVSIYDDLKGVSMDDFEVIVSDNDKNQTSRCFAEEFKYSNFYYYYTCCEGFLNSYYVLGYGKGVLLKLHNNRGRFAPGALCKIISFAKQYICEKPAIFYSNNSFRKNHLLEFTDIDGFMQRLSYLSSWSAGFCIWRDDYIKYRDIKDINKMFPQTSMLLSFLHKKKSFYIDDTITWLNVKANTAMEKNGGYNQFEAFGFQYNDLICNYYKEGYIKIDTFELIKNDLMRNFLSSSYIKTVLLRRDLFDASMIQKHLSHYYGKFAYIKLWYNVIVKSISLLVKK